MESIRKINEKVTNMAIFVQVLLPVINIIRKKRLTTITFPAST